MEALVTRVKNMTSMDPHVSTVKLDPKKGLISYSHTISESIGSLIGWHRAMKSKFNTSTEYLYLGPKGS